MRVAVVIAGIAFFVGFLSSCIAYTVAGLGVREAGLHWTEKARRVFPLRIVAGLLMFLLAMPMNVMSIILFDMAGMMPPMWMGLLMMGIAGVGVALPGLWMVWKNIWPTLSLEKFVAGCIVAVLYRFPNPLLMLGVMAAIVGSDFNWQISMIGLTALTIGTIAALCGGGVMALQLVGLARPALARVASAAAWGGERLNVRPRAVFELATARSSITNVYPATGIVAVPAGASELLDERELVALLIWEMAQLARPRLVTAIRLIDSFLIAGMGAFLVVMHNNRSLSNLAYVWGAGILSIVVVRSLARKAQLQADKSAAETGLESRDSLAALEKVFEHDLLPVVSTSNTAATPHLYDRMVAAGMTPGYPRPQAPSKGRIVAAVVCGVGTAVILALGAIVACAVLRVFRVG